MKKNIFLLLLIVLSSCSLKNLALKEASNIIDDGISKTIYSEDNLLYLKDSLPANLKLLEVLYSKNDDIKIAKNLAIGLCGYGYTFWQSERDIANSFYTKGIYYAKNYISKKSLKLEKNSNKDIQDLFFSLMFCKLAYLDTNTDEPQALEMLSDIEEIALKLYEIKPNFFNRFIASVLAYIYASKPSIAGGNIEKAKELFEYSTSYEGSNFLMNKYLYLRFSTMIVEEELFDKLSDDILNWQNDNYPYAFFNKVAQIKTIKLKGRKNDYF